MSGNADLEHVGDHHGAVAVRPDDGDGAVLARTHDQAALDDDPGDTLGVRPDHRPALHHSAGPLG